MVGAASFGFTMTYGLGKTYLTFSAENTLDHYCYCSSLLPHPWTVWSYRGSVSFLSVKYRISQGILHLCRMFILFIILFWNIYISVALVVLQKKNQAVFRYR